MPKNKSFIVSARPSCKLTERDQLKTNSPNSQNTATVHVDVKTSRLSIRRFGGAPANITEALTDALSKKYAIARPPKKCMGISKRGCVSYRWKTLYDHAPAGATRSKARSKSRNALRIWDQRTYTNHTRTVRYRAGTLPTLSCHKIQR